MQCTTCGTENPEGAPICGKCGTILGNDLPGGERPIERTMVMQVPLGLTPPPPRPAPVAPESPPTQTYESRTTQGPAFSPPISDLPDLGTSAASPTFNPNPVPAVGGTPSVGATAAPNVGASLAGPPKTAGLATVSLVAGVLSFFGCWTLAFIPPIIAIVTGFMARGRIAASHGALKGGGFALAGIILGVIALLVGTGSTFYWVTVASQISSAIGTAP